MVGVVNGDVKLTPLRQVCERKKQIDYDLLNLSRTLS
jgi:6-phosphofructokinase 1